jgi:hypothetical protein
VEACWHVLAACYESSRWRRVGAEILFQADPQIKPSVGRTNQRHMRLGRHPLKWPSSGHWETDLNPMPEGALLGTMGFNNLPLILRDLCLPECTSS